MSQTPLAIALERIEECRRTRATELDLSGLGLDEIPPEVFELTWLEKLDVSGDFFQRGEIKQIPPAISQLSLLKELNCSVNNISNLSFLEYVPNLTSLNCSHNRITDLSFLKYVPNLTSLGCGSNMISDFSFLEHIPNLTLLECGDIASNDFSKLVHVPHLTKLDCVDNYINDLGFLKYVPNLTSLDCWNNDISNFSDLVHVPNLTELYCGENYISELSFLKYVPNLTLLDCSDNQISCLRFLKYVPSLVLFECWRNQIDDLSVLKYMPNLTSLNCAHNHINDIHILQHMSGLICLNCQMNNINDLSPIIDLVLSGQIKKLQLYGNPVIATPKGILGEDLFDDCLKSLRNYWLELAKGSQWHRQLKMQLVGNGRVGKTTLAMALETGKPVEQDCPSTHGITIKTIPFKGYDDEIIDLNLWDFGGQEIYHATHRLFLANDCVYLLLWAEETEEDSNEMRHPPSYWLEAIQDLGGNSPVIIIKNQIDRAKSKSYIPADINPDELKQKHEFVGISAKKYQGMYKLRGILDELVHDPYLQTKVELPNSWVAVQTQLAELKTSYKTISFTHFQQLCQQAGIDYADWFVDYLHRIGVLFYRESAFHNQIILDQNWAIDAAYRVFDPQGLRDDIEEKRGRFKVKFARLIWPEVDDTERQIYLSFMHQCGVCYEPHHWENYKKQLPFAQREFIIPALLPKTSKAKSAWGERRADDWQLEIEYPFLHRSIIERLILRLGETYESEAWRTGIFCETEFGQVLLEAITPSKATNAGYLHFTLRAKQQSNVLVQVLRQLIDKISPHQRYKTYLQQGQQTRAELPAFKKQDKNLIISRLDPVKPDKTIRLFISYSRIDYKHKLTLEKHLRLLKETLKHKVMLTVWSDNRMDAGDGVNEQILRELRRADLIVLLVSADFLDPERYSRRVELPIALERFEKEQTPVIPVILSAVNWQEQLGHLTVATKENADPLEDWRSPHKFWQSVENGIRAQVEKRLAKLCEQDD